MADWFETLAKAEKPTPAGSRRCWTASRRSSRPRSSHGRARSPSPGDPGRAPTTPGRAAISYCRGAGCTVYDPADPRYWDEALLQQELDRVFEICHGCRMCFKYCDAFPSLFALLDEKHHGDVRALSKAERDGVLDACFQCKLCEVQCPYTPREGHAFALDFPKLVHRHQAQRRRREGGSLRDKVLGDPDLAGTLARASFGLANTMNRVRLHRWFMDKVLGVHPLAHLPNFAASTFETWAAKSGRMAEAPGLEAVLFQTCFVQNNEPQIGKDTLEVLEHNGVRCGCVPGLQCCGMPAWERGDLDGLRRHAKANLDALMPHVEAGSKVLVINPTCSMMLRREYPELLDGADRERARKLAAAVRDPGESSGPSATSPGPTGTSSPPPARWPTTPPATCAPSPWVSRAATCCARSPGSPSSRCWSAAATTAPTR